MGDVCAITFIKLGLRMDVAAVDYMTRRGKLRKMKELSDWATLVFPLKNPAATVSRESWAVFERALRDTGRVLIEVEGEEDLLVIPAVLLAPQGARVIYGLPDVGLVVAKVDDALKAHVMERAKRMISGDG